MQTDTKTPWTPGRWEVAEQWGADPGEEKRLCFFDVQTADLSMSVSVFKNAIDDNFDRARANARLIAAAPDLYEALDRLVADVADYPAWQRPCFALDEARAALASARGDAQ